MVLKGTVAWRCLFGLLIALALVTSYGPIRRHVQAARLLFALAEGPGATPAAEPQASLVRLGEIQGRAAVTGLAYGPAAESAKRTIIVAHGVHHRGMREPRLVHLARQLAAQGNRVVTPELRELSRYRIDGSSIEVLQAFVHAEYRAGRSLGLIGFSFAGSMSLLAARDHDVGSKLRYVASIGGYHDLARTLRFLATHEATTLDGTEHRKAHEYGFLLLLLDQLESLKLGADEPIMRSALVALLREDKAQARATAELLSTARGHELYHAIERKRFGRYRRELEQRVTAQTSRLDSLSPRGALADLAPTLVLIHGSHDNVIPPEETLFAQRELRNSGRTRDQILVTPLLHHVDLDPWSQLGSTLLLVNAFAELL